LKTDCFSHQLLKNPAVMSAAMIEVMEVTINLTISIISIFSFFNINIKKYNKNDIN